MDIRLENNIRGTSQGSRICFLVSTCNTFSINTLRIEILLETNSIHCQFRSYLLIVPRRHIQYRKIFKTCDRRYNSIYVINFVNKFSRVLKVQWYVTIAFFIAFSSLFSDSFGISLTHLLRLSASFLEYTVTFIFIDKCLLCSHKEIKVL